MKNSTLRTILAGEQDTAANFRGQVSDGEVFASTWNAASALLAPPRTGFKPYAERQRARLLHEGSHLDLHVHGILAHDSSERGERARRVYRQRELLGDFDVSQAYGMDTPPTCDDCGMFDARTGHPSCATPQGGTVYRT